jgi:para-aminobenzoate synthetase/4-amino-4-deoxychorismate lyase
MSLFVPAGSPDHAADCFALLDDSDAGAEQPRSRLYTDHLGTLSCSNAGQLPTLLDEMQQLLAQGKFTVGLFAYELGAAMHDIAAHPVLPGETRRPLVEILLFDHCEKLTAKQVAAWLDANAPLSPSGIANIHTDTDRTAFDAVMARIHAWIEAGDTYQVNYTYRLRFDAYGALHSLYRQLRARQPVPYGALIGLPDGAAVLSLSPELFVRHEVQHELQKKCGRLTVRPMKGTAAASDNLQQDALTANALASDPKNRAENLMIVDLLRNDLGRIATTGSVEVEKLFDVQRFSSVLQMTSTVRAQLREDATLNDIFDALYPCGSITGAPKHRTMQIIRELETAPRGIYTGAIGWFDPPSREQGIGDFCLSVPIRTLQLQAQNGDGIRPGEMGVGAGIVHDSVAVQEYEECLLKARFLTGMQTDFSLFETMHATRAEGCRYLERHLQRLQRSAQYFGFVCDEAAIRSAVKKAIAGGADGAIRMRLALQQDGTIDLQVAPLLALTLPVNILLAEQPTDADDLFLRHKTTIRTGYDAAWRDAETQGAFDKLFCNTRGELTEGGRSSLFVKLDGKWDTPPLSAGVLPGVMRAVLLDDPSWNASERTLMPTDLQRAEEIVFCNALRGVLPAIILNNRDNACASVE